MIVIKIELHPHGKSGVGLVIVIMDGVVLSPVKGSPGRFFGPIPNDDPGAY